MGFFKNFIKNITKPETLVLAAVTGGVGTFIGGAIGSYSIATSVAIRAATSAALTSAASALAPKPEIPSFADFTGDLQNRTRIIKNPIEARRLVYGTTRLSGVMAYAESTDNDKYLHLVLMLASHEISAINTIYINDEAVTLDGSGNVTAPAKYANLIRIKKHLGADNQIADSDLVAESASWTTAHRLRGIAYVYVRLEYSVDAFPNGIPNISAIVDGKKVYDPRTATTAFSNNPALCIRDYLLDQRYGFRATTDEINDTAFSTAADICDESISLAAGGTESRYTLDGTITTAAPPKQVLEGMLTACGGIVTYSNGKFSIKAAKYVSPTLTLTEDDVIAPVSVQTRQSRRDNYNAVKGVFSPPDTNYVPVDYPAFTSTTFQNEDGGQQQFLDYDMIFTTSSPMAQRLAKIALFRNRQQVTMDVTCNLAAFKLEVGDTIQFTNSRFGFSSKVFEVAEWQFGVSSSVDSVVLSVSLLLRELNSQVFDWDAEETAFLLDNTTLPDPFTLTPPGVVATDELQIFNQKAVSVLVIDVSSSSSYANQFEVQAKKSTATEYISLGMSAGNRFELVDVEDNVIYDVRARIINTLGVRSAFSTAQHQVVGKTAPPADVTDFSVNIIETQAHLSWTPVTDLDLSHYIIRHARETTGAEYANAITIAEKVSRPANTAIVPAMTGTYFIKAVDKLGNASTNSTSKVAIIEDIKGLNVVETSTQSPTFAGAKSSTVVVDNKLILDTSINFDDATGDFDDATGLFDGGGGNVASSGTYDFDNYIDLGSVYTSRVTANVNVIRADYVNTFDDAEGLFDDRTGTFDGDVQAFDDTNVELFIATTEDDPAGTPTYTDFRKFFVGDYKARAYKFQVKLTTTDNATTPEITQLSVKIDMPDRVVSGADVSSGVGSKTITFSPAYKSVQGIGIAAQDLQSGDYYAITSKSATGFTITFYNSSDAVIDRTFDYVAKGYGELAA